MAFITSLAVEGEVKYPKPLFDQNEYWGTVQSGEQIKIIASSDKGEVLINGGTDSVFTPDVGLNVYILTVDGCAEQFRLNIICRLPEHQAFSQPLRPRLHMSPELFSLNDPNGLVFDEVTGEYHLFFQCDYPGPGYVQQGDTKSWGHAVSKDLLSWYELPVAIPNDENGVIWSGSAVIDKQNVSGLFPAEVPLQSRFLFYYTYYGGKNGLGQASIGLAYSLDHCKSFINYGPVIRNENNIYSAGFRDPNIVWYPDPELEGGGKWIMIACGDTSALMFSSSDLISWRYESQIKDVNGNLLMTECPNIFPMEHGGKTVWVLMAAGTWYVFGNIVNNDGVLNFKVTSRQIYPCNGVKELWGPGSSALFPENYASQTFYNASGGRRIQISWIRDFWYDPVNKPWWNFLSLPVELRPEETAEGLRLGYYPIDEWQGKTDKMLFRFQGKLTQGDENACAISQIKDKLLLIKARLKGEGKFGFSIHGGGVKVYCDAPRKAMVSDKSGSGGEYASMKYDCPVLLPSEYADITVIVDVCSVEAYMNGSYQGGMVYGGEGLEFLADCTVEGSIEIYSLTPMRRNAIESFY